MKTSKFYYNKIKTEMGKLSIQELQDLVRETRAETGLAFVMGLNALEERMTPAAYAEFENSL